MKSNFKQNIIFAALVAILAAIVFLFATGCRTVEKTRNSEKSSENTQIEKDWKAEAETWKSTALEYEKLVKEMELMTINSDKDCPPAIERLITRIKEVCPPSLYDSVQKVVNELKSEVEYYKDGTVKYKGYMSSFSLKTEKLQSENLKLKDTVSSLLRENEQLRQISKKEAKTDSATTERTAPNWFPGLWLTLVAGFIAWYFLIFKNKRKTNEKDNTV